jgi:hypothetical protein
MTEALALATRRAEAMVNCILTDEVIWFDVVWLKVDINYKSVENE